MSYLEVFSYQPWLRYDTVFMPSVTASTLEMYSIQCEADGKRFYSSWQINHISIENDINTSCSIDVTLFVWIPKTINNFKVMLYSSAFHVNKYTQFYLRNFPILQNKRKYQEF